MFYVFVMNTVKLHIRLKKEKKRKKKRQMLPVSDAVNHSHLYELYNKVTAICEKETHPHAHFNLSVPPPPHVAGCFASSN